MTVIVRSFAKINLGLAIGSRRADGFHELRTVYQTIALHDILRVQVVRGSGIAIRCDDPRVPSDSSNTCYRIAEQVMDALKAKGRVVIEIEKRLPVQGGLGGASGNAVGVLLGLERALKRQLPPSDKLRIAAEVGSDVPLFLLGGTVLGVGRGEEVYPLPDLPAIPCVVATPDIAVSTPKAFADWDAMSSADTLASEAVQLGSKRQSSSLQAAALPPKLTGSDPSDRILELGRKVSAWLSGLSHGKVKSGKGLSGVPVSKGRGRAETQLLDLVRTGIENDFERVVFPQYPELREVKRVLELAGARYASLSGSGSATYGLFDSRVAAAQAAARLRKSGIPAMAASTMTRPQYWKRLEVAG
jgi:4-diphosphocytidyl-2-C-methyl-D-erythritol kinase